MSSQNPRRHLGKIAAALEPYLRMLWLRSEYKSDSQAEHREILSLCRARNTRGAQRVLSSHIGQTGEAIVNLLRQ
jgi:DNA-binding GntR family transcriptional regulator